MLSSAYICTVAKIFFSRIMYFIYVLCMYIHVGGRDVMLSSPSVILNADNLSGTISISAIDDVFYEGAESLQLAITSSDGAVRFLPASISVEVNIEDTDCEHMYMLYMLYD